MTTIEQTTAAPALPSWLTVVERQMVDRFPRDVADHQMTALHDDGLYRHLKFAQPDHSWSHWFEIVTWPGSLAVKGDFGAGYIFSRVTDMFEFFRRNGNSAGINPGYWSEKLPDSGRSVKVYSEEVLRALLDERLTEYAEEYPDLAASYQRRKAEFDAVPAVARGPYRYNGVREPVPPKTPAEVDELIADYDGELGDEEGARRLLAELEQAGVVSDTWEWDLSDWDWPFLWACHAIVWAIRQYDVTRAAASDA